jgi:hypothetical protein
VDKNNAAGDKDHRISTRKDLYSDHAKTENRLMAATIGPILTTNQRRSERQRVDRSGGIAGRASQLPAGDMSQVLGDLCQPIPFVVMRMVVSVADLSLTFIIC